MGEYDIGVIDAFIGDSDTLDSQNVFIGRVSKQVLEQSTVGVLLTHGDPNSEFDNLVFGSDFRYLTNDFLGKYRLEANAYAIGSHSDDPRFDDGLAPSFGGNFVLPADEFEIDGAFMQLDDKFNPVRLCSSQGYPPLFDYLDLSTKTSEIQWLRQYILSYEGST